MSERPLQVMMIVGSMREGSGTRSVVARIAERIAASGDSVDILDLLREPLPLYNPDTSHAAPGYPALRTRVQRADVYVLGSPDYHGGISGCLKNFLDHFWREFAGKLFASVVASHDKGLTTTDQIRTVARQCYAWALPYGVSFNDKQDVVGEEIVEPGLRQRLDNMARDIRVYGRLLAGQRRVDLCATEPGFLKMFRAAAT